MLKAAAITSGRATPARTSWTSSGWASRIGMTVSAARTVYRTREASCTGPIPPPACGGLEVWVPHLEEGPVVLGIGSECCGNSLEIGGGAGQPRRSPGTGEDGEEDHGDDRDLGDHRQEFDAREAPTSSGLPAHGIGSH